MEQFADLLKQLAAQLGTTTEYLWKVLIVQARVTAITDIVFMLAFILANALFTKKIVKYAIKADDDGDYGISVAIGVLGSVFEVVLFVFFVLAFFEAVTAIANPEYWALKEVLSAIRK